MNIKKIDHNKKLTKKNKQKGYRQRRNPEHRRTKKLHLYVNENENQIIAYATKLKNISIRELLLDPVLKETMDNLPCAEFWPPLKENIK